MQEDDALADPSSREIGSRIRAARIDSGMSQLDLGNRVKIGRSAVAQWERGESVPSLTKIEEIGRALQLEPAFLAFGVVANAEQWAERVQQSSGLVFLCEDDCSDYEDPGSNANGAAWGVQPSWLRDELSVRQTEDVVVHRCAQSDLRYEIGDRLVVDRSNLIPSPPGDFVYWDGRGPRVGRLSLVPSKNDHALRIRIADDMGTYEVSDNDVRVIGRIRGYFRAIR